MPPMYDAIVGTFVRFPMLRNSSNQISYFQIQREVPYYDSEIQNQQRNQTKSQPSQSDTISSSCNIPALYHISSAYRNLKLS